MIVTTAGRTNDELIIKAKMIAESMHETYLSRRKKSIVDIQKECKDNILVVGQNRLEIYPLEGSEPLFFHPNSAMFRIKRLINGETDPFLQATQLEKGMSFLDCTLGLGSDSTVASYLVGNTGHVQAVEGNPYLFFIVKAGLQTWDTGMEEINQSMRSIQVTNLDYNEFLKSCPSNSFDVVYFDPMFEESIKESNGIRGIKPFAIYGEISKETIFEAKRVARKRVVLKNFWKSSSFEDLGFHVYKRKTAKFHYGTIELG